MYICIYMYNEIFYTILFILTTMTQKMAFRPISQPPHLMGQLTRPVMALHPTSPCRCPAPFVQGRDS